MKRGAAIRGGGAAVWNIGAYDPESTSRIGAPEIQRRIRKDVNGAATICTAIARPRSTRISGSLSGFCQFTPQDEMDYDATQVPVLADLHWPGKSRQSQARKVMLWANRNGLMYVWNVNDPESYCRQDPFP